ncbi:hypothetical protein QVD17_30546 [Tagetes erecta]|uniref:Uncharacterized protein n=1 Tax=Tagetes erecta TaxID=13708 RepID=A0AAD8K219_TARER|nr:hypothetical protein QVD17_30546 [Tagetes erecta]
MTNYWVKTDLQDLNDRSWKQTVTLLKYTEKFPMDLDLLIAIIEEVEIDENSRLMLSISLLLNPPTHFHTDSTYHTSSPIYKQPQSPPKAQSQPMKAQLETQSSIYTIPCKVKDVMNILLQYDETKNPFTAFMASFQVYQGSHLT